MTLPMMGTLTMKNAYEITDVSEGPDGTVVVIVHESILDADSLKPPESSPIPMNLKAGTIIGTLRFDPVRGFAVESGSDTEMTLEAMGMEVKTTVSQSLKLME